MKKIITTILLFTLLIIPTCVNANGVSWADFIDKMEEATGDSNFEENIKASSEYTDFVNRYNGCKGFSVWGDFAFASTSPTKADNTKLWFCFYVGGNSIETGQFYFTGTKTTDSNYLLKSWNSTYVFIYDIESKALTETSKTTTQNLFSYYLSANNTFSLERFLSETGADYFIDTSLVMAWNMSALVRYMPDASSSAGTYVEKVVDLSTVKDSDYPWEDNNSGDSGSGDSGTGNIVGDIEEGNNNYWGTQEDIDKENQEYLISGEIENAMNNISGEMQKNEVFGILNNYHEKIWGMFNGEKDFIIEWDSVQYMGKDLIPAGNINFTEICEEEPFSYIKYLINTIVSFGIIISLIQQIYNLILSTLGIDNPYLYEDENYMQSTDAQTGEVREKYYKNRRVYKK